MKGSYLTVEYLLFFGIGVGLVIGVYFLFSGIGETVETTSTDIQLQRTAEYIRGTILNTYEASKPENTNINYKLKIPEKLSSCIYAISFGEYLTLNCTHDYGINAQAPLYNINIISDSIIYSTKGILNIDAGADMVRIS